jgi:hypothetical protein
MRTVVKLWFGNGSRREERSDDGVQLMVWPGEAGEVYNGWQAEQGRGLVTSF